MKKLLILFIFIFLLVFCKKNESADPYTGTFDIVFKAGTNVCFFHNDGGDPGIKFTSSEWKIENNGKDQYTLAPINDLSRIVSSVGLTYISLITRPATLTNNELFTFEPTVLDKNYVNVKSVANNKYIVYQYGLMPDGTLCCWAFSFDNKTPCNSNWSTFGANISDCQYDFKLIKK